MTRSDGRNRKFVLAKRPRGEPDDKTLRLETEDVPTPGQGHMLLRNEYLSLDPYMRGRMSDAPSYAAHGRDQYGKARKPILGSR